MIRSLLKKRKGHADTHKEEELGRMEAETGARQLEAEDCMEPSEGRRGKERFFLRALGRSRVLLTPSFQI